ncbi:MAG: glycoside hydrolase family 113 [Flavobacteriales bacterium]
MNRYYSLFLCALMLLIFMSCGQKGPKDPVKLKRIQGVNFKGSPIRSDLVEFINLKNSRVNYVSLMPFAMANQGKSDLTWTDNPWQYWGESAEGIQVCVDLAKEKGMMSMIKPMIWLMDGAILDEFDLRTESDWELMENKYRKYILEYAEMSEKNRLPLYCIGSELDTWAVKRPEFWRGLIAEVRKVYNGDLIYACRSGMEERIVFWDALDYVGLTVYESLSGEEIPSVDSLTRGWQPIKERMRLFSEKVNKRIIFTEWGYTRSKYCAQIPDRDTLVGGESEEAQANCYDALLSTFEKEPWWVGGFIWQWFPTVDQAKNAQDFYSPQERAAQKVLMKHWKK